MSATPPSTQAIAKPTKPAVVDYVEHDGDSRISLLQAQQSTLPHTVRHQDAEYFGDPEQSIKTSMLPLRSDFTSVGSLPELTRLPTPPGVPESASDGMGGREIDQGMRLLVPDQEGVLETTPLAPLRSPQQDPTLECPFPWLHCYKQFAIGNERQWLEHIMKHFVKPGPRGRPPKNIPPPKVNCCCFCDSKFESTSGILSWRDRMSHVELHHKYGHRMAHARIDFALVEYMWEKGLIAVEDYRELKPSKSGRQSSSGSGAVASINENGRRGGPRGPL